MGIHLPNIISSSSNGGRGRPQASYLPPPSQSPLPPLYGQQQQQSFQHQQEMPQPRPGSNSLYQPFYLTPEPLDLNVKLRLEVRNLGHAGAKVFFECVNPAVDLMWAVEEVFRWLYTPENFPRHVRSVTLYLEEMGGVAYTKGSELDDDHKEIHFSLQHIMNAKGKGKDGGRAEVLGVLVHELVHCFQYNGKGTCPGGLVEGIADFVRLKAGLSAPHWKRGGNKWDDGYQTTGYFLDWIERKNTDFVRALNGTLSEHKYDERSFVNLTGRDVQTLWKEYKATIV